MDLFTCFATTVRKKLTAKFHIMIKFDSQNKQKLSI
jgi:hypothetical protein